MLNSGRVEWLREGDTLDGAGDAEAGQLRDRLLEVGAIRPSLNGNFAIRFVGVVVFRERTIVVLPKVKVKASNEEVHRLVTRSLRTYNMWTPTHHDPSPFLNSNPDRGRVSGLSATDWLLTDFNVHGLYRRTLVDFEVNGLGRVNWGATISKIKPILSRRSPIYVDTVTRRSEDDPTNFATMLHLHLLEHLSAEFGPVLDYEPINLDHEAVDRFDLLPTVDECERRLHAEMLVTYSERGLELLAMLLATVKALEIERSQQLSLYGTNSFHNVWEAACAAIFGNSVEEWKSHLPNPLWTSADGNSKTAETFIPDLVVPLDNEPAELLIADAKYYRPIMPPNLSGVPGVNDVAKQIWYKQYLAQPAHDCGYETIQNVFLFPADGGPVDHIGKVEFPFGVDKVDALSVDFTTALKEYCGSMSSDPRTWRGQLSQALNQNRETIEPV